MTSETQTAAPYFAFKTLTNMIERMEEHGPPPRIDRTFLTGMSGAGQTQFISGLRSLGLIDPEDNTVLPPLTALVENPDQRPELIGELVRTRYPEAVELGKTKATTGQLVEVFAEHYGVRGDTARKAIAFFLKAAEYGGVPVSPNFKTPARPRSNGAKRAAAKPRGAKKDDEVRRDPPPPGPTGLHPALAGLLGDIPKRGETWTQQEHDDFMAAFTAIIKIAAPVSEVSTDIEVDTDDDTDDEWGDI